MGYEWLAVQLVCDLLTSVLLFWRADSGKWGMNGWLCRRYVTCSLLLFWRADSGQWGMNGWLCRRYVTCPFLCCYFGGLTVGDVA